jgi:glutaminase
MSGLTRFIVAVPLVTVISVGPGAPLTRAASQPDEINSTLKTIHRTFHAVREGEIYQSGAKEVDPDWFGIAVATVDGAIHTVGDTERPFPIQSTAKAFTYGLALEDHGAATLLERVGVNATGLPYNSLIASEIRPRRPQNPMVSAGAIATMALIHGADEAEKWQRVRQGFARFAGGKVELDRAVYDYEIAHSTQSFALGYALLNRKLLWVPCGEGRPDCLEPPPDDGIEPLVARYLKSTSQQVTTRRLALMGATLANGGINPKSKERAISADNVAYVLSAMLTAGMYDASGEWMSRVGLPAKSGVSGNILAVVPGRMAIAVYSPPLDASGNSVRGVRVIEDLARRWSLHLLSPSGDGTGDGEE